MQRYALASDAEGTSGLSLVLVLQGNKHSQMAQMSNFSTVDFVVHCFKAWGLVFIMIPVKKSLEFGKIFFKITYIGANTAEEKRIVSTILHAFRCREQLCIIRQTFSQGATHSADPICLMTFWSLELLQNNLRKEQFY